MNRVMRVLFLCLMGGSLLCARPAFGYQHSKHRFQLDDDMSNYYDHHHYYSYEKELEQFIQKQKENIEKIEQGESMSDVDYGHTPMFEIRDMYNRVQYYLNRDLKSHADLLALQDQLVALYAKKLAEVKKIDERFVFDTQVRTLQRLKEEWPSYVDSHYVEPIIDDLSDEEQALKIRMMPLQEYSGIKVLQQFLATEIPFNREPDLSNLIQERKREHDELVIKLFMMHVIETWPKNLSKEKEKIDELVALFDKQITKMKDLIEKSNFAAARKQHDQYVTFIKTQPYPFDLYLEERFKDEIATTEKALTAYEQQQRKRVQRAQYLKVGGATIGATVGVGMSGWLLKRWYQKYRGVPLAKIPKKALPLVRLLRLFGAA